MAKGADKFKSRKVYKTTEKPNGDGTDDVWKNNVHFDMGLARLNPNQRGSGFVTDTNIPRANSQPYKRRPGKPSEEKAMWDSYRKATKGRKGNRETK